MMTKTETAGNPTKPSLCKSSFAGSKPRFPLRSKLIYVLMDEETRIVDRIRSARAGL